MQVIAGSQLALTFTDHQAAVKVGFRHSHLFLRSHQSRFVMLRASELPAASFEWEEVKQLTGEDVKLRSSVHFLTYRLSSCSIQKRMQTISHAGLRGLIPRPTAFITWSQARRCVNTSVKLTVPE